MCVCDQVVQGYKIVYLHWADTQASRRRQQGRDEGIENNTSTAVWGQRAVRTYVEQALHQVQNVQVGARSITNSALEQVPSRCTFGPSLIN
jgi:hypothetical protein